MKPVNKVGRASVAAIERRLTLDSRRPTRGSDGYVEFFNSLLRS